MREASAEDQHGLARTDTKAKGQRLKAKVQRMGARGLWRAYRQLSKLEGKLKKAAAVDQAVAPIHKQLDAAQRDLWKLWQERQIAEAKRADKGEVLWTIYKPRASWMDRPAWVMRTPHLTITQSGFFGSKELGYYVHDYPSLNKPWEDLAKELERSSKEFSIEKMRERAALLDAKPKGFFAAEFGELEEEEKKRLEKLADEWCRTCGGRGFVSAPEFKACGCTMRAREEAA